ncbi:uncharacterized protein LOC123383329 isoform X3 [Felis catus]|uniref:uncharacterized protein LOC123383329 isoform X3 n=1 Tax=Felis catus TaxID=9685 RepID=UPI0005AC79E1|nr:uncharacterized protein LOC123383329 isoform X3 [Felis catus]XP_044906503.1 uncharacterized protein LOC123383329 isoform X3 [Felis catus]
MRRNQTLPALSLTDSSCPWCGVVCVCWEFFCEDPDLRGKGVSSGASGDGWKVGVQGSCPHGKKGMRKRKPRLAGGGQDSLSGGPPPRCRYRLKTCPCTSSRQDGSFWTSVKGSPLQESVAGELPPFGVTGPRNNTVIRLAPVTTCLGLPVPAWPPCIQSPCIQSPWRCPCCCSTSWTSWGRRTRSWRATTRSWGTGAPRGSCSTFRTATLVVVAGYPAWRWSDLAGAWRMNFRKVWEMHLANCHYQGVNFSNSRRIWNSVSECYCYYNFVVHFHPPTVRAGLPRQGPWS